jgi:hypothetical protein
MGPRPSSRGSRVMAGTVELLALELGRALQPLEDRLTAGQIRQLFAELGLQFPPALETQGRLVDSLSTSAAGAARLAELVPDLVAAIEAEDEAEVVRLAVQIVDVLRTLIPALTNVASELQSLAGTLPGIPAADVNAFAADLPQKLLQYILVSYLESFHPILLRFLALAGLVEITSEPGVAGDPTKPPHTKRELRLDRLGGAITDPEGLVRDLYDWGDPAFDGRLLLERIKDVLASLAIPVAYDPNAVPPVMRILLLRVSPRTDLAPPGLEFVLELSFPVDVSGSMPVISSQWALEFGIGGTFEADLGVTLQPPADIGLVPPSGALDGHAGVGLARVPVPGQPIRLIDIPGGTGLRAERVSAGIRAEFHWDSASGVARGDFGVEGSVRRGTLVVTLDEADGFLAKLLAGFEIEVDFDLGFGWTAGGGFFFTGSSTLEIKLPVHVALGPVELTALTAGIGVDGSRIPIGLAADLKAELGPLRAVVEEIGFAANLSFPPDRRGNLGPIELGFEFLPPKGAGLSLDAGVIKGGGYLFFDNERGEYAGALELSVTGIVTLKAIGLITTRMPDGSRGFSLLIIITAEFGTGIQLGFGFTLLGVGGLLGLNRTVRLQPLIEGVRTGAVNSIMFPRDPVANAPRIISDLRAIFPPQEGIFLIGPMAKLGWGTPMLVSLSLGIIIEIPGNIAILGVLRVALPAEEEPIVVLQVSFAGAIEFDKKRVYFFASLFESRILFLTIEGEMALLVATGDDANFVLSVGGFHPQFDPPPLPVPVPRRVAINIINEPAARLRVEGYFAVTTNTAQFGARAEAYFGFSAFSVEGHLGFDALLQFSPFYFIVSISAEFSLKVGGVGVFGIRARFSLEGPTPWRAKGTGSISILFFEFSADFDVTWGERRETELPPISVMPLVKGEFDKQESWRVILPPQNNLLVSLRVLPGDEASYVLHPVGTLRVSQKAVPLDLILDKVGNQRPVDANRLTLRVTGGGLAKRADVEEQFAPAQFKKFDDAAKLSQPAFEPGHGGIELSVAGAQLSSATAVKRVVRYELITIDSNFRNFQRYFVFIDVLFVHFLAGASVSRSPLSRFEGAKLQPFEDRIEVGRETYVVANQADNIAYAAGTAVFTSEAMAHDFVQREVEQDAALAGELHVIPAFEVVA